jgi:tetratricopeptide (TPR) repeat protein
LSAGKKEEATQAYRKATEVNPYYWLNYSHLGSAYFKFGQNEEALAAFQKVTQLAPDSEDGYANIGAVYYRQGKWDDAISAFQKALDRKPSEDILTNLGTTYFYLGRYADAAKTFEKAVDMNPDQQTVGNLADAYRWLGQRDKANATYDRAIALALSAFRVNSRDTKTLEYLALYYAKKGDAKRAQDFIRRARGIDSNDNELMYNEGVVNALAGRKTDALQCLRLAFQHGYSAAEAKNDPELKGLQADPEFDKLLHEFGSKPR